MVSEPPTQKQAAHQLRRPNPHRKARVGLGTKQPMQRSGPHVAGSSSCSEEADRVSEKEWCPYRCRDDQCSDSRSPRAHQDEREKDNCGRLGGESENQGCGEPTSAVLPIRDRHADCAECDQCVVQMPLHAESSPWPCQEQASDEDDAVQVYRRRGTHHDKHEQEGKQDAGDSEIGPARKCAREKQRKRAHLCFGHRGIDIEVTPQQEVTS